MNPPTDPFNLLADVLAESNPAEFRADVLAETLRLARRRRQFRQVRATAGMLAVLGLLAVLMGQKFFHPAPVPPLLAQPDAPLGYQLVRTQPLPAAAWVQTGVFAPNLPDFAEPTVSIVTSTSRGYHNLDDDELLAFLEGRPAILVRTSLNSEELVFADPKDRHALFSN